MSDNTRAEVERIAAQAQVGMTATYVGLRQKAFGGDTPADHWCITFTKHVAHGDEVSEVFEFFTGLALRAEATQTARQQAKHQFPGLTQNDVARRTLYGRRYLAEVEKLRKPQAPHMADVLHSLILDSSAVGVSFDSWCNEFGYDSDSRKAETIYRACQENADKLARIFNANDRQALADALQDY